MLVGHQIDASLGAQSSLELLAELVSDADVRVVGGEPEHLVVRASVDQHSVRLEHRADTELTLASGVSHTSALLERREAVEAVLCASRKLVLGGHVRMLGILRGRMFLIVRRRESLNHFF